tara:strand:+ start:637 stop:855 length:219 start_codon:yes stop_codon:yes gene_type:complete
MNVIKIFFIVIIIILLYLFVYGYYDNNVQFNKNFNNKFNENYININNFGKKSVSFADENNKPLETLIKIKKF